MSDELGEALTAANLPQLLQKVIDPVIMEYQRRFAPLLAAIPSRPWKADEYYFNRRTKKAPGGFVVDGGARPFGNSEYQQDSFKMKHLQAVGGVTGYAQEVTADLIGNLRQTEIESASSGLLWDIETAVSWGHAPATANGPWPQFSGLDAMVSQFASDGVNMQNALDMGGNPFTQGMLDIIIDVLEGNASAPVGQNYMLVMSSTMGSREAQIQMALQRNRGDYINVAAGLDVASYRNVPILTTSFLSSRAMKMGTVVGAGQAGGTLPAGQYRYVLVPRMARYGVLSPSPEVAVTVPGSGMGHLEFNVPRGPEDAAPLSWEVYRSAADGPANTATLLGIVDAVVGLQGDGITPIYATGITDTGSNLVPTANGGTSVPAATPSTYVGGQPGRRPRVDGAEDIYLVPRDADKLVRPWVRELQPVSVYPTTQSPDQLPFALVADTVLALRGPKFVGRIRNVVPNLQS